MQPGPWREDSDLHWPLGEAEGRGSHCHAHQGVEATDHIGTGDLDIHHIRVCVYIYIYIINNYIYSL